MKPIHIVYLSHEYPPVQHGGIGTVTQNLARGAVTFGNQVTVLGVYREIRSELEEDDYGVRVIRLPSGRMPAFNFLIHASRLQGRLLQIDRETPIDIIEGQEAAFAFFPRQFPSKKVIRMHGGHHFFFSTLGKKPRLWRAWQEKRSFARSDVVCAVSEFVAETTNRLIGRNGGQTEVIPNSVDTGLFYPNSAQKEVDGRLLFVGTVCEKKGIRELVKAMPSIIRSYPAAHLLVVGRDGVESSSGQSFTESLYREVNREIQDRLQFLGPIPHEELPSMMATAQVCIFPSHMESQGLVVVEAMASGKAVVSSCYGPGPELIADGKSGLLCDSRDPGHIAAKVIQVLKDPALRESIGRVARNVALERFSSEVLLKKNIDFYQRIISDDCQLR